MNSDIRIVMLSTNARQIVIIRRQCILMSLAKTSKERTMVVCRSEVQTGSMTLAAEVDNAKYGFVAVGTLNPQKARILLMLSLTQTKNDKEIQQMFQYY